MTPRVAIPAACRCIMKAIGNKTPPTKPIKKRDVVISANSPTSKVNGLLQRVQTVIQKMTENRGFQDKFQPGDSHEQFAEKNR